MKKVPGLFMTLNRHGTFSRFAPAQMPSGASRAAAAVTGLPREYDAQIYGVEPNFE